MEFVTWDDDIDGIPNWMESHEKFHGSSHHQAESIDMGVSENVVYPFLPNGFADHYPY